MHFKEVLKASNLVRLRGETAGSTLLQADIRSQDSKTDRSVQRRLQRRLYMLPCWWFLYLFIIRMELCAASRSTEATPNELYVHAEKARKHKSSASNNLPRLLTDPTTV